MIAVLLTLLEPPGFGDFCKKNNSFRLPYQHEVVLGSFWLMLPGLGLFGHLGPLCLALGANH